METLAFFLIDLFDCFFLLTDCFIFLRCKRCDNTRECSGRCGEAFHLALAVSGAFINMYNEVVACSSSLPVPHKRCSGGGKEKKEEVTNSLLWPTFPSKRLFSLWLESDFFFFPAASSGGQVPTTALTPHASSESHSYFRRASGSSVSRELR